ncbi:hypothetical protein GCM10018790_15560 [Kitasatospora xanthocidica]|uniref:hypothetical protein n=1 Tax=Kitasatospora xanthocidica TaxID=83382 RepID=UPI00167A033E|nr:hypothetical protein [Kitasatospora xanthocidica]GHF38698.1 hypothetical protein GCM10018790_15560 [Kitasatospora xanthocidica]
MLLLLGLLLMTASGAFVGLLIADNLSGGPDYQVTVLGNSLATLDSLGIFLSGVSLALVFCLGLALMTRRSRRPVRPGSHRRSRPAPAQPLPPTRDEATAPAEDRAAEQGGGAVGTPAEPARGGRIRHLFGHQGREAHRL